MLKRLTSIKFQVNRQKLILLFLLTAMSLGQAGSLGQVGMYFSVDSFNSEQVLSVSSDDSFPCASTKTLNTSTVDEGQCEKDSVVCFSCSAIVTNQLVDFAQQIKNLLSLDKVLNFQSRTLPQLFRPPINTLA